MGITYRQLKEKIEQLSDKQLDLPVSCFSRFWFEPEDECEFKTYDNGEFTLYVVTHRERDWRKVIVRAADYFKSVIGGTDCKVFIDLMSGEVFSYRNGIRATLTSNIVQKLRGEEHKASLNKNWRGDFKHFFRDFVKECQRDKPIDGIEVMTIETGVPNIFEFVERNGNDSIIPRIC